MLALLSWSLAFQRGVHVHVAGNRVPESHLRVRRVQYGGGGPECVRCERQLRGLRLVRHADPRLPVLHHDAAQRRARRVHLLLKAEPPTEPAAVATSPLSTAVAAAAKSASIAAAAVAAAAVAATRAAAVAAATVATTTVAATTVATAAIAATVAATVTTTASDAARRRGAAWSNQHCQRCMQRRQTRGKSRLSATVVGRCQRAMQRGWRLARNAARRDGTGPL